MIVCGKKITNAMGVVPSEKYGYDGGFGDRAMG